MGLLADCAAFCENAGPVRCLGLAAARAKPEIWMDGWMDDDNDDASAASAAAAVVSAASAASASSAAAAADSVVRV